MCRKMSTKNNYLSKQKETVWFGEIPIRMFSKTVDNSQAGTA